MVNAEYDPFVVMMPVGTLAITLREMVKGVLDRIAAIRPEAVTY
jgi:hypothetical protein